MLLLALLSLPATRISGGRGAAKAKIWPSAFGGKNWMPMSFSPLTGLVYVNTVNSGWEYEPQLLARRDSLAPFATFHMAGHWDPDGSQMVEAIQRVVARRTGRKPRVTA